jgi:hypothetical protein
MSRKVTARFYVHQITDFGNTDNINVVLQPAYSEGQNKDWAKYTPSGKIELSVHQDAAAADFFRELIHAKDKNIAVEFSVVPRGE